MIYWPKYDKIQQIYKTDCSVYNIFENMLKLEDQSNQLLIRGKSTFCQ